MTGRPGCVRPDAAVAKKTLNTPLSWRRLLPTFVLKTP
jgi:hypothetical protein